MEKDVTVWLTMNIFEPRNYLRKWKVAVFSGGAERYPEWTLSTVRGTDS